MHLVKNVSCSVRTVVSSSALQVEYMGSIPIRSTKIRPMITVGLIFSNVAQLVEQLIVNQRVGSSSLSIGAKIVQYGN